jgi:hypothetical protein
MQTLVSWAQLIEGHLPPWWAMIEDSAKEFLTASSWEGSFGLPSPRRRSMGASFAPVSTMLWMDDALSAQAMTTVPPRTAMPWPETGLSSK